MARESMAQRVEQILAEQIGREAARTAAERWQHHYADQPGAGVLRFVQEIAQRNPMEPSERQRLRRHLFRAIYADGAGAPGDSHAGRPAPGRAPSAARDARESGRTVCAALIAAMVFEADDAERSRLLGEILHHMETMESLDPAFVRDFGAWTGSGMPPAPVSEPELRAAVHAAYLGLCQTCGPDRADRLLRRGLQKVEASDAARLYPTRYLL